MNRVGYPLIGQDGTMPSLGDFTNQTRKVTIFINNFPLILHAFYISNTILAIIFI